MEYQFKTQPFRHQLEEWERSRDTPGWAIFWEQGTGKSKLTIDTFAWQYLRGEITGVLVVAPNGVHRNWVTDELPTHLPEGIQIATHIYEGEKADTRWHQEACKRIVEAKGLAFMAISYDAWMTKRGKAAVWNFLKRRRTFLVLDESGRIKTPAAKRTQSILAGSIYAPYRRILSGTPISTGPFDVYSQVKAVDPDFWVRELNCDSFASFKAMFGVFEKGWNPNIRNKDGSYGAEYDQLIGFQNIPELKETLRRIASRVTKEDVLDLPPKLYSKRYYEMTPAQRRVYDTLEEEFQVWLDSGEEVTATLAIVRQLRLQQVLCGYIPVDADKEPVSLIEEGKKPPRLAALIDRIEDTPDTEKTIIWAAWDMDIDQIMRDLRRMGRKPVQYDGRVSDRDRARNKDEFQKGDATEFVAKASTAGEGLTLTAAHHVSYYNNTYRLIDRLQSEDRAHRIGQEFPVDYTDYVCAGTRDEHAIRNLVEKRATAQAILGDEATGWIE